MSNFPRYLDKTEQRVISAILDVIEDLANKGQIVDVCVDDEDTPAYIGTMDRSAIEESIGHTGITYLTVSMQGGGRHQTVFVHGNGEDVVANTIYSPSLRWFDDMLSDAAIRVIEEIEAEA